MIKRDIRVMFKRGGAVLLRPPAVPWCARLVLVWVLRPSMGPFVLLVDPRLESVGLPCDWSLFGPLGIERGARRTDHECRAAFTKRSPLKRPYSVALAFSKSMLRPVSDTLKTFLFIRRGGNRRRKPYYHRKALNPFLE